MAKKIMLDPFRMGPRFTSEDMDIHVLRFQHEKMKQTFKLQEAREIDLKGRIAQLEKRQVEDDAVLNVINRYWNQFNEDINILLQRFDAEVSEEYAENRDENEATTSFLTQLSIWDKHELDEKLANRVQVSTGAVSNIIRAFDRLQKRNDKIAETLNLENHQDTSFSSLNEAIKEVNIELEAENQKIQALNAALHEKYQTMSLKMTQLQEQQTTEATKGNQLQNQVDNLNWDVSKLNTQNQQLKNNVQEWTEKCRKLQQLNSSSGGGTAADNRMGDLAQRKMEMSEKEIFNFQQNNEELQELASNRLIELEQLQQLQRETLKNLKKLRVDICQLAEREVVETSAYKCLQSKFSVAFIENKQLRANNEKANQNEKAFQTTFSKVIAGIRRDTAGVLGKMNKQFHKQEERLDVLLTKYISLRGQLEQEILANEQIVPMSIEMRNLIADLKTFNQRLKGQANNYKKKTKDMSVENQNLKDQNDELEATMASFCGKDAAVVSAGDSGDENEDELSSFSTEGSFERKNDDIEAVSSSNDDKSVGISASPIDKESKKELAQQAKSSWMASNSESDNIKQVRSQLKKAQNEQKEMKLVLDMYKGWSKDQWEKVELMVSEKKNREEVEQVREAVKKLEDESKKEERKKLADEDTLKRIKCLEKQIFSLQMHFSAQKQEEEALLSEMEVTGQAYEVIQEDNSHLIQQLREKDNANFNLVCDRNKSDMLQEFTAEEIKLLNRMVDTFSRQLQFQNILRQRLDERGQVLLTIKGNLEKQANLWQQATDSFNRTAIENAQSAADLTVQLEKYQLQMKDAHQTVAEKTCAKEEEDFRAKRLQEEILSLKRKAERLNKKVPAAGNLDEVMKEEVREYKEALTCPSCKVKRKDAVLTKCFHVFCFDCLRTRYETRQRKCPKCNAVFGGNDYHRIFLF